MYNYMAASKPDIGTSLQPFQWIHCQTTPHMQQHQWRKELPMTQSWKMVPKVMWTIFMNTFHVYDTSSKTTGYFEYSPEQDTPSSFKICPTGHWQVYNGSVLDRRQIPWQGLFAHEFVPAWKNQGISISHRNLEDSQAFKYGTMPRLSSNVHIKVSTWHSANQTHTLTHNQSEVCHYNHMQAVSANHVQVGH